MVGCSVKYSMGKTSKKNQGTHQAGATYVSIILHIPMTTVIVSKNICAGKSVSPVLEVVVSTPFCGVTAPPPAVGDLSGGTGVAGTP